MVKICLKCNIEEGFKLIEYKNFIFQAGHWWLSPIILATQEAENRRISV
jgi:hypothetical protein